MGRWTQYEEDEYRLPEGVKRVAYDADSACYTFRDHKGTLYQGPPGEAYGVLKPISAPQVTRPVFDTDIRRSPKNSIDSVSSSQSFHDFLPADRITRAEPAPSSSNNPFRVPPPHKRGTKDAIKRPVAPAKPSMMRSIVRVMTFRGSKKPAKEDDKDRLLLAYARPETDWDLYENYSAGHAGKKTVRFGSGKNHQRL